WGYLLLLVPPRRAAAQVAAFWAIGLSAAGAIAVLPIWLARAIRGPGGRERLLAAACAAPSCFQLAVALSTGGGRTGGASAGALGNALRALAGRVGEHPGLAAVGVLAAAAFAALVAG